jgi:hypothetical protein
LESTSPWSGKLPVVARVELVYAHSTRSDMPSINEEHDSKAAAEALAIFRKSDELRNLLENELPHREKNETSPRSFSRAQFAH